MLQVLELRALGSGVAVGIDLDTTWRWDGTAKQRAGLFYSTHVSKHGSRGDIDRKILVGVVIRRPSTTEAGRLRGANCRGWGEKPLRRLERSSSRDIPYRLPYRLLCPATYHPHPFFPRFPYLYFVKSPGFSHTPLSDTGRSQRHSPPESSYLSLLRHPNTYHSPTLHHPLIQLSTAVALSAPFIFLTNGR